MQACVVHYHIFKNAGSSFELLLDRQLGDRHIRVEGQGPTGVLRSDEVRKAMAEHPDCRAVSTHLGRPGPMLDDCIPVVFLRDPIDRARSVYRFLRLDPSQQGHAAAEGSFGRFVEWALASDEGGVVIRDYQTIHLSEASFRGHIWQAKATDQDLRAAIARLNRWAVIGIARRFAASIQRFDQAHGDVVPGVFVGDAHANVTHHNYESDRQEWDAARLELGPRLFDRLIDANALDLQLYRWAVEREEEGVAGERSMAMSA